MLGCAIRGGNIKNIRRNTLRYSALHGINKLEIKISDSAEFQSLLEALASELVEANIRFKLYADLTESISEYQEEYNQSTAFWSLTFQSHLDAAVFRLCKIYDQHAKTLNLRNLLDTTKANIYVFDTEDFRERLKDNPFVESLSADSHRPDEEQLEGDLVYVSEGNPLVKNLTIWRNNFFAHRSAINAITKRNLADDYPLTVENVKELLVEGMKLINRYSNLFRATTYSTNMIGRNDFQFVLKSIREYLAMEERRIDEERKRWERGAS